jgi:hypothetical protein
MVAYSFNLKFIGPIRAGSKTQTVRGDRKRHARAGEEVQLYTGMRTNHCRMIGTATCKSVESIRFDFEKQEVVIGGAAPIEDLPDLDAFAASDGFEDFRDLRQFWRDNHSGVEQWSGILIRWTDFKAPTCQLLAESQ